MLGESDRFYVVTGGPGSGKSTLLAELSADGLVTMPEAGRAIIQDQVGIGGDGLPWVDRELFAELMLAADIRSHREAESLPGVVLFDRGVPDVVGYLRLCGLEVPEHVERAACTFRYARRVFIAPPWPEIFVGDAERKQTVEEADTTYRAMVEVYTALGYHLLELPRAPVADRVRFVRGHIDA
ncbi:AAA family ATPase [Hyphomicrobium sp. CS1GBMeth3]|uniref:AAA family ATPase n=1 Tax=Hyphomicrobium sp. CS1GBMeth3 TaxID=1892845 RepID=UPI001AEC8230|nr:AAA family ATPase [Hyphomicrobium sp. CS1GBMeth3]